MSSPTSSCSDDSSLTLRHSSDDSSDQFSESEIDLYSVRTPSRSFDNPRFRFSLTRDSYSHLSYTIDYEYGNPNVLSLFDEAKLSEEYEFLLTDDSDKLWGYHAGAESPVYLTSSDSVYAPLDIAIPQSPLIPDFANFSELSEKRLPSFNFPRFVFFEPAANRSILFTPTQTCGTTVQTWTPRSDACVQTESAVHSSVSTETLARLEVATTMDHSELMLPIPKINISVLNGTDEFERDLMIQQIEEMADMVVGDSIDSALQEMKRECEENFKVSKETKTDSESESVSVVASDEAMSVKEEEHDVNDDDVENLGIPSPVSPTEAEYDFVDPMEAVEDSEN